MSRVYDTIEPSVIDEEMLMKCVEEQGPKGEAGRIVKKEGIDFSDVIHLRLDFKNILKIDNLWQFKHLVKLQLDNNIIEKIEGLELLVNLEWLDLSFNNIEEIEGLDTLTQLTDLTLYNNRISKIQNMDTLEHLHVLSLGNNNIGELSNVLYMRKFKQLNSLNLNGNPICKDENYHTYVIAHLPSLVYLEYRLIDEGAREAAIESYKYSVEELSHDETISQRKIDEAEKLVKQNQLFKEAYIEDLDGPELFESMYADDPDGDKLSLLPGMDEMLATYRERFVAICKEIAAFGLKEHTRREMEKELFYASANDAVEVNRKDSIKQVKEFNELKTRVLGELATVADHGAIEKRLKDLSGYMQDLWTTLMSNEMQLVDQLEVDVVNVYKYVGVLLDNQFILESIKDFERNMADMVSSFVEHVQGLLAESKISARRMTQCRELEGSHNERVSDLAIITLEKLMKNELEEDLPDELRLLFVDKDSVTNAVTASHDAHLLKIDNKEDYIVTRANSTMQGLIEKIHNDEILRNRNRVGEINNLMDHFREEIDNFEPGAS